ncbi:MAG: hypothetical protein KJ712_03005 [Bacteroidetes bacterium]|nr:hypothetical protein [Bacteroidota bacterium]MBU1485793.1 hypothetical protein [Bacteroidota bacterium]MBU2045684.1 hypothetical protein [Bacteroidota bacterium]MBU2267588.1 hypothetical protein [Bacteroidota bacterium]MBU2376266.1 hypothetical protein [Bacteroidota bacterium]
MKRVLTSGLTAGFILSILGYGSLFLAIKFFPSLFASYNNPLFNSDGSRDILFYMHAFVLSMALAWFWERFKGMFAGGFIIRGIEFGFVYAIVSLIPVMWITFSALDVTATMVLSWLVYGLFQAIIAGVLFAKMNP